MMRLGFVLALVPAFVLIFVLAGWVGAAQADDEAARSDADACQPDIHRLCDKFFPDEKLVAACLVDRRAELSVACAQVLARPPEGASADPVAPAKAAKP